MSDMPRSPRNMSTFLQPRMLLMGAIVLGLGAGSIIYLAPSSSHKIAAATPISQTPAAARAGLFAHTSATRTNVASRAQTVPATPPVPVPTPSTAAGLSGALNLGLLVGETPIASATPWFSSRMPRGRLAVPVTGIDTMGMAHAGEHVDIMASYHVNAISDTVSAGPLNPDQFIANEMESQNMVQNAPVLAVNGQTFVVQVTFTQALFLNWAKNTGAVLNVYVRSTRDPMTRQLPPYTPDRLFTGVHDLPNTFTKP